MKDVCVILVVLILLVAASEEPITLEPSLSDEFNGNNTFLFSKVPGADGQLEFDQQTLSVIAGREGVTGFTFNIATVYPSPVGPLGATSMPTDKPRSVNISIGCSDVPNAASHVEEYNSLPAGTLASWQDACEFTALHEFGHAINQAKGRERPIPTQSEFNAECQCASLDPNYWANESDASALAYKYWLEGYRPVNNLP